MPKQKDKQLEKELYEAATSPETLRDLVRVMDYVSDGQGFQYGRNEDYLEVKRDMLGVLRAGCGIEDCLLIKKTNLGDFEELYEKLDGEISVDLDHHYDDLM